MTNTLKVRSIAFLIAATASISSLGITAFADEQTLPTPSTSGDTELSAVVAVTPSSESYTEPEMNTAAEDILPTPGKVLETEVSGAPEIVVGDVNGDGEVNVADVSIISAYIKGFGAAADDDAADVNNDGTIDVEDLSLVSAIVKGF